MLVSHVLLHALHPGNLVQVLFPASIIFKRLDSGAKLMDRERQVLPKVRDVY